MALWLNCATLASASGDLSDGAKEVARQPSRAVAADLLMRLARSVAQFNALAAALARGEVATAPIGNSLRR